MRRHIIKLTLSTALLCASLIFTGVVAANDTLGSAEIKNLRFLSQAILQTRLQDKNKIAEDVKQERESIKNFQRELQSLEQEITKISLEKNIGNDVIDSARLTKTKQSAAIAIRSVELERKHLVEAEFSNTLNRLKQHRTSVEDKLPRFWQIWKTRTTSDNRKQRVVDEMAAVEKELATMSFAKNIDIQKLKKLNEKVQLKKREMSTEKIDPTIQTITKHRH